MSIKWLQLPGVMFASSNKKVRAHSKFEEFYRNTKESVFKDLDYLIITGDLHIGCTEDERTDEEKKEKTIEIIEYFQKLIGLGREKTFIVQGESDICASNMRNSLVRDAKLKEEDIGNIVECDKEFYSLQNKVSKYSTKPPICVHATDKVNFVCINSSVFCTNETEKVKKIPINYDEIVEFEDDSKPKLVIAHHDFSSFETNDQKQLELYLKEMDARLYVCGHNKQNIFRPVTTYKSEQTLWEINCGSGNIDKDYLYFSVGELSDKGNKGEIKVYKWSDSNKNWLPDNEFYTLISDGKRQCLSFNLEAKNNEDLREYIIDEYFRKLKTQCKGICLDGIWSNGKLVPLEGLMIKTRFLPKGEWAREIVEESKEKDVEDVLLKLLREENVNCYIGAELGGGKTTFLEKLALKAIENWEPDMDMLFPIWIQCRYIVNPRGDIRSIIKESVRTQFYSSEEQEEKEQCEEIIAYIEENICENNALLLFDGLDEIISDSERESFLKHLQEFICKNALSHVVISSRIDGYKSTYRKAGLFKKLEISPLLDKDIKFFCNKWCRQRGVSREKSEKLIHDITSNSKILKLARNPMLLTMLLMIQSQRGMELPQKRSVLYHSAVEMFIEKWNAAWHEGWNVDEMIIKLSYVAFCMTFMKNRIATINKADLISKLIEISKMTDVFVDEKTKEKKIMEIEDFLRCVEQSSGILIERGGQKNSKGEIEPIYVFRHQSLQEYLAAYALNHGYYPEVTDENPKEVLVRYNVLNKESVEEAVVISAELSDHHAIQIVDELCDNIRRIELECTYPDRQFYKQKYYKRLIIQMIVDGVRISKERRRKIYQLVFERVSVAQIYDIKELVDSRFGNEFGEFAMAMLEEALQGKASYDLPIMYEICKENMTGKEIYFEYKRLTKSKLVDECKKAMMYADVGIMLSPYGYNFLECIDSEEEKNDLLNDFVSKIQLGNEVLSAAAAAALTCFVCIKGSVEAEEIFKKKPELIKSIICAAGEVNIVYVLVLCQYFDILNETVNAQCASLRQEIKVWLDNSFVKARGHSQKIGCFWGCVLCEHWSKEVAEKHYREVMEIANIPKREKQKLAGMWKEYLEYKGWNN